MYKCEECNLEFKTFQAKANHVRWQHKDNTKYYKKAKSANERVHGKWIEEDIQCSKENCNNVIHVKHREGKQKEKYFCSRSCANSRNHSKETKKKISDSLKHPEKTKICLSCGNEFIIKRKDRTFCSNKCSMAYRNKDARLNMSSFQLYKRECLFNFNLKDFPNEFNFSLIEQYGWYKAKNHGDNLNGISRDHMFSIKEGFLQNIDPKIISHPANCQLMRHNDNASKHKKCSLSLRELKNRINEWDKKYK